jgi:hypothetical protein
MEDTPLGDGGDKRLRAGPSTRTTTRTSTIGERLRGTRSELADNRAAERRTLLAPAYISCDVRPESSHAPARWSIHGDVALTANEAARSGVKDHNPKELQIAVGVILDAVGEEAGRRLRVNQFWPQVLNFTRKYLRSFDGQKPWVRSKARCVFCPVGPGSSLSQSNGVWARITSVDREITVIDFLGVEVGKDREKQSKKKTISSAHKECLRTQWSDGGTLAI